MNRKIKLKINGESPRSLLLAFVLSKFNCEVYINDYLEKSNFNEDQIFCLTSSSKNILSNFGIWDKFEDISYGFTSFCFMDATNSRKFLFRKDPLTKNYPSTLGWAVKYSDIISVLIDNLITCENIHFLSKNKISDESLKIDYEFNFNCHDKVFDFYKLPLSIFRKVDEKFLIFNVSLRGNVEKRLYEIHTTKGLLFLTPIDNNLYQIIWKNKSLKIKERAINSRNFLIDNLSTLLPNELKIDQIFGDINYINLNMMKPLYFFKNKSIFFNECKFKSNPFYDFNFDIFIRNIFDIYNYSENKKIKNNTIFFKHNYLHLLTIVVKFIINIIFSNLLINLFISNNIFLLFIRKLTFSFLNRINLFIMKYLYNYKINNLLDMKNEL